GDAEHGVAVLDSPLEERAARCEVHDVVLIYPRRAGQQRHRVHLLGLRRVPDQLHQLVAVHDRSRGGAEVLADLEAAGVDLARLAKNAGFLCHDSSVKRRSLPVSGASLPRATSATVGPSLARPAPNSANAVATFIGRAAARPNAASMERPMSDGSMSEVNASSGSNSESSGELTGPRSCSSR